ncbi:MAG: SET domain-containing protein-lysine N-methyltransferase, partial [Methanosarcinales archaeon]
MRLHNACWSTWQRVTRLFAPHFHYAAVHAAAAAAGRGGGGQIMSAQSQHVDVRFQEWLRAAGAETTKLRWPVEFPVTGRGVAVTEACKKGDVLCRLPSAVMLTVDRALAALSPWWPAALSQHTDNDELLLACYILAAAGADVSSSHAPSMESLRRLVPYVHVLPPASDFDAIATEWTSAELGLLADAQAAQATLAAQIRLAQEFADVACALSKAAVDDAVPQALARVFDWANYRWARYCVRSRAFINGLGMDPLFMCMDTVDMLPIAMVPLGDMLNHTAGAPNAEADWVAEASPSAHAGAEATGWYNLIARASIAAGTEVCISYGDRSSRDMIENYGFCIPPAANPAESLSVDMLPVYAHAC